MQTDTRPCTCSAVWLDNATDRPVSFRLHVPSTPTLVTDAQPGQGTGAWWPAV